MNASVDRVLATIAGHLLMYGWIADDGTESPVLSLTKGGADVPLAAMNILRHARPDVEPARGGRHDVGFFALAQIPGDLMDAPMTLHVAASGRECHLPVEAERVSTQRLLEDILAFSGHFQAHGGREPLLHRFLQQGGHALIDDLARRDLSQAVSVQHTERFGPKRAGISVSTVLFGDVTQRCSSRCFSPAPESRSASGSTPAIHPNSPKTCFVWRA